MPRTAPHRPTDDVGRIRHLLVISRPVEDKGGRRRRPSRRTRRRPRSGKTQASRGPVRDAQEVVDPDRESGRWMWMRRPPFAARSCTSSSWGGTTPSPLPVASSFLVHEIRDTIVVIVVFLSSSYSHAIRRNFLDVIEFQQRSAAAEGSAFVPPMPTAQSLAASERGRCARAATHDLGVHPSFRGCFPQSLFLFSSSMQRRRW